MSCLSNRSITNKINNMIIKFLSCLGRIFTIFKSRTVWTIIVLFSINGIAGIREFIPSLWLPAIDGVLAILAIYFRAKPRIEFSVKK